MTASSDTAATGDIDVPTLKKLIAYCRERCAPRLSDEASALLSDQYVHIRNSVRESLKNNPTDTVVVPITIRQLEALVRLSESLAKMRLSAEATVSDVEEALRLFKVRYTTHYITLYYRAGLSVRRSTEPYPTLFLPRCFIIISSLLLSSSILCLWFVCPIQPLPFTPVSFVPIYYYCRFSHHLMFKHSSLRLLYRS
jgi:hypothetical protein